MNDQLTRALTDQAERFANRHTSDLSIDGVLQRADEIRRGRRMRATLVMAAAALAVVVPVGITVSVADRHSTPRPIGPASPAPVELGKLRTGPSPRNGYVIGRALHHGDRTVQLTGTLPLYATRINGGYLIVHDDGGGIGTVRFLADQGSGPNITWPISYAAIAVSPGANVGAFAEPDGTVMAIQDGGSRFFEVGRLPGSGFTVVAVSGENCSGRSEAIGCTVYVSVESDAHGHPRPRVYAISPHRAPTLLGGFQPTAATDGMLVGSRNDGCAEVRSTRGRLWSSCEFLPRAISPDGKRLVATEPINDAGKGMGYSRLAVLDARTGAVRLDLHAAPDAAIASVSWEDATHVLALVEQGGHWAALRIGLDGSREYAIAPLPADTNGDPTFSLG